MYRSYSFTCFYLPSLLYTKTWILNRKVCANSHYFLSSFILFLFCPCAAIKYLIRVVRPISSPILHSPSLKLFLDLSTLELVVGTSIGLEYNQIQCCSQKEKKKTHTDISSQRYTINREQLAAYRDFISLPNEVPFLSFISYTLRLCYWDFLGTWHT